MESIERAIRSAFAKADAYNPTTRQRIYESAWGAHQRALAANDSLSEAQKEQRRQALKETISNIEREFAIQPKERAEPTLDAPGVLANDPVLGDAAADRAPALDESDRRGGKRGRKGRVKKRRSPLYSYGLPALVLGVAALIAYSLYNSFADFTRAPTNSPLLNDASMAPLKQGEEAGGMRWVTIFTPTQATHMSMQGRATAEIVQESTGAFVRVKSPAAADTVTFEVGQGVLDQLAGKKATFDVMARSQDGQMTQMSVDCDFGGLGACERRRYDVNESLNDFLFDATFPAGSKAAGPGSITVSSDVTGGGKTVNIYAIRVSVAAQ